MLSGFKQKLNTAVSNGKTPIFVAFATEKRKMVVVIKLLILFYLL